jgi:hypothetical protein
MNWALMLAPISNHEELVEFTESECIQNILLVGLAARNPMVLCTTGAPIKGSTLSSSWLCGPPNNIFGMTMDMHFPHPQFPRDVQVSVGMDEERNGYIQLDLIFSERRTHHIEKPEKRYIQEAEIFFAQSIRFEVWEPHLQLTLRPYLKNVREHGKYGQIINTIACLFERSGLWPIMTRDGFEQFDEPLAVNLTEFFLSRCPGQTPWWETARGRAAARSFCTVVSGIVAFSGIPVLDVFEKIEWMPTWFFTGDGQRALTFIPSVDGIEFKAAIPDAIKGARGRLPKVWILCKGKRYTGPSHWIMWGKSYLHGDRDFFESLCRSPHIRVQQRVFGLPPHLVTYWDAGSLHFPEDLSEFPRTLAGSQRQTIDTSLLRPVATSGRKIRKTGSETHRQLEPEKQTAPQGKLKGFIRVVRRIFRVFGRN